MMPKSDEENASAALTRLLRRYVRRQKRFCARNEIINQTAAQTLLNTLVREAVALVKAEEDSSCPYFYVMKQLGLTNHETTPISNAIFNALVQDGLATLKEERWRDMWQSRDGSFYFAGAIGEPLLYVTLTQAGLGVSDNAA